MQIIATFQGALGTELSVETWLTVAQCIWYWVVRTSLYTFSAVGKFKFYLCRVINACSNIILCIQYIGKTLSFIKIFTFASLWTVKLSFLSRRTDRLPAITYSPAKSVAHTVSMQTSVEWIYWVGLRCRLGGGGPHCLLQPWPNELNLLTCFL